MASFSFSFVFSFILFLALIQSSTQACKTRYYPGFAFFRNNLNQTLLTLPNAGDFVVKRISEDQQRVWINDPRDCLPTRFLRDIDLRGSPFRWSNHYYDFVNVDFLNCTTNVTDSYFPFVHGIRCLSSDDHSYSVVAVLSDPPFDTTSPIRGCRVISSAWVPVDNFRREQLWSFLYSDIQLQWKAPNCVHPETSKIGISSDSNPDQETPSNNVNFNLPDIDGKVDRMSKLFGVGIGGAICLGVVLLARFLSSRRRQTTNTDLETSTGQSRDMRTGLDGLTIELYPKIQVSHSGRLPNPSDNVCSICLCEYEPMQTLRTIPHCNHYFHANCIDGWLKLKATCPLCRYLPVPLNTTSDH